MVHIGQRYQIPEMSCSMSFAENYPRSFRYTGGIGAAAIHDHATNVRYRPSQGRWMSVLVLVPSQFGDWLDMVTWLPAVNWHSNQPTPSDILASQCLVINRVLPHRQRATNVNILPYRSQITYWSHTQNILEQYQGYTGAELETITHAL